MNGRSFNSFQPSYSINTIKLLEQLSNISQRVFQSLGSPNFSPKLFTQSIVSTYQFLISHLFVCCFRNRLDLGLDLPSTRGLRVSSSSSDSAERAVRLQAQARTADGSAVRRRSRAEDEEEEEEEEEEEAEKGERESKKKEFRRKRE